MPRRVARGQLVSALLLGLGACAAPPPSERGPHTTFPPRAAESARDDGAAPAAATVTEDLAPRPECVGRLLELDRLAAISACNVRGAPRRPVRAGDVALRVTPAPLVVTAGERASATLAVESRADRTLPMEVDVACDLWRFSLAILAEGGGERVDQRPVSRCTLRPPCPTARTVRLGLEPGGTLKVPLTVDAAARPPRCEEPWPGDAGPARLPLAPGRYVVAVTAPLGSGEPLEARGPLLVRGRP